MTNRVLITGPYSQVEEKNLTNIEKLQILIIEINSKLTSQKS